MPATDLERLVVQLSADVTKYEKALNRANGITATNVKKMQAQATQAGGAISDAFTSLGAKIVGVFGILEGAKAFVSFSDSATKITNSLKTTGLEGDALTKVMDQLYAVALKNGAPIEALAQLYSRVSVVQKELGVSSEQLIGLTDNVGKSLKITGTSAEEASGTLLQLAQAFGGNKIQAQEYNSLIDGALPLLKAAAAGIKQAGGSVSTLTQLVKAGKISNKAFFDGIEAGSFILDQQLGGATETVGQAMTNLTTSLTKAVGKFNDQSGAANGLATAIQGIADALPNLKFDGVIGGVQLITAEIQKAINKFDELLGLLPSFHIPDIGTAGPLNPSLPVLGEQTNDQKLTDLANQRLSVEQKIADIHSQGLDDLDAGKGALIQYGNDLQKIDDQVSSIKQSVTDTKDQVRTVNQPAPPHSKTPLFVDKSKAGSVDITAAKYVPVGGDGTGGKGHHKADPFKTEVDAIQKRTAATVAETEAQAKLNPVIDDYGYAVAKAKEQSLLDTAAKEANKAVTPELTAQIDQLSTAYANSVAAANKLDDAQRNIAQRQEEIADTAKDVSRGIVDGFVAGQSAAKTFSDALSKIGSKLLDLAFDDLFDPASKGGAGLGGMIASLFKGIPGYAGGTPSAPGGLAWVGEKGPELMNVPKGAQIIPNGKISTPVMPSLSRVTTSSSQSISYSPTIDARGADVAAVARLQQALAQDRKEFSAKVVSVVRSAKKTRQLGMQ